MKKIQILILTFLAYPLFSFSQFNTEKIDKKDLIEDFEILERHLKVVHAGLYNYQTVEVFQEKFNSYKKQLNQDFSPLEFYKIIGPIISDIGDAHTEIEPQEDFYKALNNDWLVFPISVYWIQEKLYVFDDFSEEQSFKPGDQLISINGVSAIEIFKELRKYVPRDGYNLSGPNHTLSGTFGQFRNYYASLYGHPDLFEIEIKEAQNPPRTLSIKALPYKTIINKFDKKNTSSKNKRLLHFEQKENAGILTIKSFHPGKLKNAGFKFKSFFKKVFKEINNSNIDRLVIDIQGNGGGHESVFIELFSYLTDRQFSAYKSLHTITSQIPDPEYYLEKGEVVYLEKWAKKNLTEKNGIFLETKSIGTEIIQPKKLSYQGKLFILVDGKSSSAAGDFSGLIMKHDRAVFVGEESGGNPFVNTAGTRLTLILPHSGLQIIIPVLSYTINNDGTNKGQGVLPNYPIENSIEDLIKKNNKAMEFVLSLDSK